MHDHARRWVAQCLDGANPPPRVVVEFGSRDLNGTVRDLFRHATTYLGIDIEAGSGVDMVADATSATPTLTADCVVCCEVLEHHPTPWDFIHAAGSWLRPGGLLIVTAAGPGRAPHSGRHAGKIEPDEYYDNVDPAELYQWLDAAGFIGILVDTLKHDVRAVAVWEG